MIQVNTLDQDVIVVTNDDDIVLVNTSNNSPGLSSVLRTSNDGGAQQIKNIGDPTNNQDAVTLAYFNAHSSSNSIVSVSGTANQIGAVTVAGAVTLSLPNSVIFPGTWAIGALNYSDTGILWSAQSLLNSYNQVIIQNTSNGTTASTNFLVSNDLGTATTHFLEIGKNSSGFTGTGSFAIANASYLDDASDDLVIGTLSNKTLHFVTNNAATDNLSITGSGVFTYNVPINGSVYSSTWTATANNQNAFEYNGTITSRNTASDTFNYLVIDPTLARNAGNPATQTATAVLINPTFSNSPATPYILRLQNAGSDLFIIDGSGNIMSTKIIPLTGIAGTGQVAIQGGTTGTSSTIITSSNMGTTGTRILLSLWSATSGFTFGSGVNTGTAIKIQPALNIGGGTNTIIGIDYAPTETSMTGTTHYFLRSASTTAMSGFGIASPTAMVHIAASSTVRSSLNIASGTAPTSPNDGDMWYDGTNIKFRVGAATKTFTIT